MKVGISWLLSIKVSKKSGDYLQNLKAVSATKMFYETIYSIFEIGNKIKFQGSAAEVRNNYYALLMAAAVAAGGGSDCKPSTRPDRVNGRPPYKPSFLSFLGF